MSATDLNPRPVNRKSDALPVAPPSHSYTYTTYLQPSLIPALVVALSVVSVSLVNNTQRHVISRPTAAPCDTISSLPTLQPCWFHDTGQPCVSGVCSESLEFPASSYHGCAFTARLLLRTQTELFRLSYPAD